MAKLTEPQFIESTAGKVAEELARRGITPDRRVTITIEEVRGAVVDGIDVDRGASEGAGQPLHSRERCLLSVWTPHQTARIPGGTSGPGETRCRPWRRRSGRGAPCPRAR